MAILLTMFAFSFAMSISPGPVNLIIFSSGISNGFKRTLPFVSGATIGFTLLLFVTGFGLYTVVETYPIFLKILAVLGSSFIFYIGFKVFRSDSEVSVDEEKTTYAPKFHEGFLLQWLNPKAWAACLAGVSIFSNSDGNSALMTFITIYFFICYACLALWAALGDKFAVFFGDKTKLKRFNQVIGTLLMASSVYLLFVQMST